MGTNLNRAIHFLKQYFSPLADISDSQLKEFLNVYSMDVGDSFTVSGTARSYCMFILDGEVEQLNKDGSSTVVTPTDTMSRPICVSDSNVTFTAKQATLFAKIDLTRLDFLLGWINFSQTQEEGSELTSWLQSVKSPLIFKRLPLENVRKVYERLENIEVKAGDEIVIQGEIGDYFYMIEDGDAEVWQTSLDNKEPKLIAKLSAGQQFGEDALIMKGKRNATVKMSTDGRLKRLGNSDFNELINLPMEERVSDKVALAMIDDGAQLLDVRYEEEYDMEYIADSSLIPLHELRARMSELDRSQKYVVYCYAGPRSSVATYLLNQNGFNAVSIEGGICDWSYGVVS